MHTEGEGPVSEEFDKAFWEDHYHRHPSGEHARPRPHLVQAAGQLVPGAALDAGCGEGADAVWLAAHDWRVTAVDVSATALARARKHAAATDPEHADRIDWVEADLTTWAAPEGSFDLVSVQYVHPPAGTEADVLAHLAASVAPGGTLLVVDHEVSDLQVAHAHGADSSSYLLTERAAALLDPEVWDIVVAADQPRRVHSHERQDRHPAPARDTVLRARRRL